MDVFHKIKRAIGRRVGINAPRVAIRVHTPWYMRALIFAGIALVVAAGGWVAWQYGSKFSGHHRAAAEEEVKRLTGLTEAQATQLVEMRQRLAASESQRKIDTGSFTDLARQVKTLSSENASLKDDLAFFHSLLPPAGGDDTPALGRLRVEPDVMPGEFRFRMLLVRGGQRPSDFVGHVQLVVSAVNGADKVTLTLPPDSAPPPSQFQLDFKSFQRVEGGFKIAPGAVVKSVQVRVYQNGVSAPKLAQTVNL